MTSAHADTPAGTGPAAGTPERPAAAPTPTPGLVTLDDGQATEPGLTGSKAATLARAADAGLAVVPGFVLTTAATDRVAVTGLDADAVEQWRRLSRDGEVALVVRSSSTVEDLGDSSMAGRFASVVGVRGRQEFEDAVRTVIASRSNAAVGSAALDGREPLAVLVQPLLDARSGGVLFGIDPVTGREDRLVVAAVEGGPDRLVSGTVDGSRYVLERDGTCVEVSHGDGGTTLRSAQLVELARLAARTAEVFGGPQDVEWAYDGDGQLRLLQSRPVTATPRGVPEGPVLGPGPVAETFPQPLRRLEQDLWLPPLREALTAALRLAGTAAPGALERSPVLAVVGGHVALDLELLEPPERRPTALERLDPRPRWRRLRASWRVGRLRAALPSLGRDVVAQVDDDLAGVPELPRLTDRQLVALLHRAQGALMSVHAHEALVGLLIDPRSSAATGVGTALRVLAQTRAAGLGDAAALAQHPVLLALVPPAVEAAPALPAQVAPARAATPALRGDGEGGGGAGGNAAGRSGADGAADAAADAAAVREALRLRARWLQQLTAGAAYELGKRLSAAGRLPTAGDVADVDLDSLTRAVEQAGEALTPVPVEVGQALPARFRLSDRGLPVAEPGTGSGTGAGGGRGRGPVHQGDDPPEGTVLVVRSLDPALAPVLPRLAGLVAETGSVLAHLAILARESGVPTVVGLAGVVDDLPPGTVVEVDGDRGRVERAEEDR